MLEERIKILLSENQRLNHFIVENGLNINGKMTEFSEVIFKIF